MKVEIKDNQLCITCPVNEQVSKSGKSLIIASSGGNQPVECKYKGLPVIVGLNAYVKRG